MICRMLQVNKMADLKDVNMLADDVLDSVTGGAAGAGYSDSQYKDAGVIVTNEGRQKEYYIRYGNGQMVKITQSVANDIYDIFKIGNTKPSDQMIKDLLKQS